MNHSRPHILDEQITGVRALHRLAPDAHQFDESWLQALLFSQPQLLPAEDVAPNFGTLVPLAREFSVTSGSIDLLYATPDGALCLVETKLWRNPEAHRTVLAQLLDYAKDLSRLDFVEFKAKIESIAPRHNFPSDLYRIMAAHHGAKEFDSIQFEQGVRHTLATGDFLLLIVGDRIRPEVALLTDILGTTPHLEFSLALVELNFYHLDGGEKWPLLAVPSVVGRSHEQTRAVVRIRYEEKRPEVEVAAVEEPAAPAGRTSLEVFLKDLPSEIEETFRVYLERWMASPLVVYFGQRGLSLRFAPKEKLASFFYAYPAYMSVVMEKWLPDLDDPGEAYRTYRDDVADIPAVQRVFAKGGRYVYFDQMKPEQVETLLQATDRFAQALVNASLRS